MRRKVSLFFIFIAVIVIVAHSAIPHHHEDGVLIVCKDLIPRTSEFNSICNYNKTNKTQQEDTSQKHNIDECQLENIYIRLYSDSNNSIVKDINLNTTVLYFPISIFKFIFPDPSNEKDIFTTYTFPIYDSFITQTIALRAPPKY